MDLQSERDLPCQEKRVIQIIDDIDDKVVVSDSI